MSSPYIEHVTLTTGHRNRSSRSSVSDDTLSAIAPWVRRLVESGARLPLPTLALAHYSASATSEGGGLLATIHGPLGPHTPGRPHHGDSAPLVTLGVAQRSRQGRDLWALMVANFGVVAGLQRPAEPWCAVSLHQNMNAFIDAVEWLGDMERCIAWAWITRHPLLGTV